MGFCPAAIDAQISQASALALSKERGVDSPHFQGTRQPNSPIFENGGY